MENKKNGQKVNLGFVLDLAWKLGYIIALPIVGLVLGGRLVDKYFGTSPIFLIAGLIISAPTVGFLVYRKMKGFIK